jgi:hypothetical protein
LPSHILASVASAPRWVRFLRSNIPLRTGGTIDSGDIKHSIVDCFSSSPRMDDAYFVYTSQPSDFFSNLLGFSRTNGHA